MIKYKKYLFNIVLILLCFTVFNCSDNENQNKNGFVTGEYLITKKDGLIYKEGSKKPFTGKVKGPVKDKTIEYEVKNGKKDGPFVLRYSNGQIEMIGKIINNKNEGLWKYFYSNSILESEGHFKNDLVDGEWKWYYKDGSKKQTGIFRLGMKEGKWILYKPDGSMLKKNVYKNDEEISSVTNP